MQGRKEKRIRLKGLGALCTLACAFFVLPPKVLLGAGGPEKRGAWRKCPAPDAHTDRQQRMRNGTNGLVSERWLGGHRQLLANGFIRLFVSYSWMAPHSPSQQPLSALRDALD